MNEIRRDGIPGLFLLVVWLLLLLADIAGFVWSFFDIEALWPLTIVSLLIGIVLIIMLGGFFKVAPNEGKVFQLFGAYRGTARQPGLRWTNPFYTKEGLSLRVRNFETGRVKVNDRRGNPIEIAAVVVWRVVDSAEATFQVDDYENYVHVQSEAAVRNLATGYSYDAHEDRRSQPDHAHRRNLRAAQDRDSRPAGASRRRGPGGARQPPRLCPGDRRRYAAPAASQTP